MSKVNDAVIDGVYKLSQAIWEKHGWMTVPKREELVVYLEATMLYMNEHKRMVGKKK